jgi:hypothetical protein
MVYDSELIYAKGAVIMGAELKKASSYFTLKI